MKACGSSIKVCTARDAATVPIHGIVADSAGHGNLSIDPVLHTLEHALRLLFKDHSFGIVSNPTSSFFWMP